MLTKPFADSIRYFQGYLRHVEITQQTKVLSAAAPIRHITLVGAKTDKDDPGQVDARDRYHLNCVFDAMARCGASVHPDMELEIANIRPEYGGQDILERTAETDMLVYCFVHNPDPGRKVATPYHLNPELQRDFLISAHHYGQNVWHDSAVRVRAKILAVIIGELSSYRDSHISEINHRHFLHVPDGQFEKLDNFEGYNPLTLLKRRDFCLTA